MNVLIVCTGNTCRSPMAAAYLKHHGPKQWEVRSAGVYAMDGASASANAKKVLEKNQISSEHASTSLSVADIKWADIILTMTESHKQAIAAVYPQALEKMYTLKESVNPESVDRDIVDPFGGSLQVYEQAYKEIADYLEKWMQKQR